MPQKSKRPVGRPRKKVQINIRLDLSTKKLLAQLARASGRTQTDTLVALIEYGASYGLSA